MAVKVTEKDGRGDKNLMSGENKKQPRKSKYSHGGDSRTRKGGT
jgi:hypothetical protein